MDEGPLGLSHARFAPDGRHVLTVADCKVRITIWSLLDRSVRFIRSPKFTKAGLAFSNNGSRMALAHRNDEIDELRIYASGDGSFSVMKAFEVGTMDLADIKWSPDSKSICILDGVLFPKVLIYDQQGRHLATHKLHDVASCDGPGLGLGPRAAEWSTLGSILAIGCRDGQCQLLNALTWQCVSELSHPLDVRPSFSPDAAVYMEIEETRGQERADFPSPFDRSYKAMRPPLKIESSSSQLGVGSGQVGSVSRLSWSSNSCYLATCCDSCRKVVWVWDMSNFSLSAALVHLNDVHSFSWHSNRQVLAICTGQPFVYLWSPVGCRSAPLPESKDFKVTSVAWNPVDDSLLLISEDRFCICFVSMPETGKVATVHASTSSSSENEEAKLMDAIAMSKSLGTQHASEEQVSTVSEFSGGMLYGLPPSISPTGA